MIMLAGAIAIPTLPIARFPELTPPSVTVLGVLHRRQRAGGRERGHHAARAGDQRRRGHDLHAVVEHQQRRRHDHGHVRHRPQSRPGGDRRAEPRQPGARPHAGRRPHQRHHGDEEHRRLPRRDRASSHATTATTRSSSATTSIATSRDAIKRVPGVGNVIIFGERKFAMRLWLDPDKLAARGLTAGDVVNALREQNVQVAAGALGDAPGRGRPDVQAERPRAGPADRGRAVRRRRRQGRARTARSCACSDIGRVELGAETYAVEPALPAASRPRAWAFSCCRRPTRWTVYDGVHGRDGAPRAELPARARVAARVRQRHASCASRSSRC